jgi:LacI family transcriptional regulator
LTSIKEIASKADVSYMTVSRVLKGGDNVKPTTRKRVLAVMREHGYVPSVAARSLRSKDKLRACGMMGLGVIFGPDTAFADNFFADITRAVEKRASDYGLCPLQVHLCNDADESWRRLQNIFSFPHLCGCLLIGQFNKEQIKSITNKTSHVVTVDSPIPVEGSVTGVSVDYVGGCLKGLRHLVERGGRRLVVITGPREHYFSSSILQGIKFIEDRFEHINVLETDYTCRQAYHKLSEHIKTEKQFDCIFGNDEAAIGALRALKDAKLQVPEQVKVVGFDNIDHTEFVSPRLTSISVDKSALGTSAVDVLIQLFKDNDFKELNRQAPTQLVIRESS